MALIHLLLVAILSAVTAKDFDQSNGGHRSKAVHHDDKTVRGGRNMSEIYRQKGKHKNMFGKKEMHDFSGKKQKDATGKKGKKSMQILRDDLPSNEVIFGACTNKEILEIDAGIECAFVEAPLDYYNPRGEKIQIAISRYQHTDEEDYRGVLVLNPGGPGGAGLILSAFATIFDSAMAAKYDWIGYDMRGSGESIPSLNCGYQYDFLGKPAYDAQFTSEWLKNGRNFARACEQNHADFLPHISNANHARDVERIREVLGSDILNFYGFSYGTLVAQLYATMYPERVGKFVLDSVSDANGGFYEDTLDVMYSVEKATEMFFEWTAGYDSIYNLGTDAASVRAAYQNILDDLMSENTAVGEFGPAEWAELILSSTLDSEEWPDVANILSRTVRGLEDRTTLVEMFNDPQEYIEGNIETAGFSAIVCRDNIEGGFPSYTEAAVDFERASEEGAPLAAYLVALSISSPCFHWSAGPEEFYIADRNYDSEMLLVHIEFDANTPLHQAYVVRDRFRKSSLVMLPGEVGHAKSTDFTCLMQFVTQYLLDGSLPSRDPQRGVADYICEETPPPLPNRRRAKTEGNGKQDKIETILRRYIDGSRRLPFRRHF